MNKALPFTKMHGAGNDYVYVNGFKEEIENPGELAKKISDRHFGVGSDGLVLLLPSAAADLRMRMFNSDGTEAEMCGNATRCVGKLAYDLGIVKKNLVSLETAAGVKIIRLKFDGSEVCGATVDMGEPVLAPELVPADVTKVAGAASGRPIIGGLVSIDGVSWGITAVSMGNPHAVIFMTGVNDLDLSTIGPKFESHPAFPQKVNTEFVEVSGRDRIKMRVWERGAGETLACGTGACAAVVACVLNGFTERKVRVDLKGGTLTVNWEETSGRVFMSGPAVTVFTGQYYL